MTMGRKPRGTSKLGLWLGKMRKTMAGTLSTRSRTMVSVRVAFDDASGALLLMRTMIRRMGGKNHVHPAIFGVWAIDLFYAADAGKFGLALSTFVTSTQHSSADSTTNLTRTRRTPQGNAKL